MTMETDELVEHARLGDLQAFNNLVLAYQERMYNQAYRLMGDPLAAEDATQDAFISAYNKLDQFRGGSFQAWLLRIVTNLCLDELRRIKRRKVIALNPVDDAGEEIETPCWLADTSPTPEEVLETRELDEILQRCLDQLPTSFRTAVILVDLQGLDYAEAATVMGTAIGTLKSRVARGRQKVLEAWQELNGEQHHPAHAVGLVQPLWIAAFS